MIPLHYLSRFSAKHPEYANKAILNVKGAMRPDFTMNGDPAFVKKCVENCLTILEDITGSGKDWRNCLNRSERRDHQESC